MLKILEHIAGEMERQNLSRSKMAYKMNEVKDSSGDYTKEKLDKIFSNGDQCPRTETISTMLHALGLGDYPVIWYRSKKGSNE